MSDIAASNDEFFDAEPYSEDASFALNFSELRAMLFRQRYILITVIALALLIGLVATLLMTPIYQATSKIQINADSNEVIAGDDERPMRSADIQRFMTGQIETLKSRKMASRVADQLKLGSNTNFMQAMNVEPVTQVGKGRSLQRARKAQIVDILTSSLEVNLPFGTNVASVNFQSPSGKTAIQIANAYSENLITANIERRFGTTAYARKFLEKEIAESKKQLEVSERASIEYARDSRIIDASDGVSTADGETTPKSITTANLVASNSDLATARTERIKAAERWNQARRTPLMRLPEVIGNATIQNLQAQKVQKQSELQDLSARYKSGHPAMQTARDDVSAINSEISRLASNIRGAIQNEYNVARRQEQSLSGAVDRFKTDTLAEQNRRVELNLLGRDVDTNRVQYQALLERYKQLNTTAGVVTNNILIIDDAEDASQISPRLLINLFIAGILGAALAALIAFLREMVNDGIAAPAEIASKLGIPLLGVTPLTKMDGPLITELHNRKTALSEAYASIRSALDFSTRNGAPASFLVTSAQPSEGKTTSAIALAESFGQTGKRVLLVDADLRNPSLHRYLNVNNNKGFVGMLTGQAKAGQVIVRNDDMAFDLMPSGPVPPNPAEILVSDAIRDFLEVVAQQYDHVIIDGPPIMGLADSPQIGRATAGTVMIVQSGGAMRAQTQAALRRMRQANASVTGAILSQFDSGTLGYGDYYGYSYKYGKGDEAIA